MRVLLRGVPLALLPGSVVTFKVSLQNATPRPAEATLPSSKRFDLRVRDPDGRVVFDAHEGHLFLQVLTPLRVEPGRELALGEATWRVPDHPRPGTYHVEAEVPTTDGSLRETVAFDVRERGDVPPVP